MQDHVEAAVDDLGGHGGIGAVHANSQGVRGTRGDVQGSENSL